MNARTWIPRSRSFQSPKSPRQNLVQKGQKKLPVKDSIEKEEIGTAIVSSSDTYSLKWNSWKKVKAFC